MKSLVSVFDITLQKIAEQKHSHPTASALTAPKIHFLDLQYLGYPLTVIIAVTKRYFG